MRRMYSIRSKHTDSNRTLHNVELTQGEKQDVSNTTKQDNNVIEIRKYRVQRATSSEVAKEFLALIALLKQEDEKPGN